MIGVDELLLHVVNLLKKQLSEGTKLPMHLGKVGE